MDVKFSTFDRKKCGIRPLIFIVSLPKSPFNCMSESILPFIYTTIFSKKFTL